MRLGTRLIGRTGAAAIGDRYVINLPTTCMPAPTMMPQPGLGAAVSIQSLLGNAGPNKQHVPYDIVDSDCVQILLSSKKNGLPKGEKLKGYLYDVVTMRMHILKLEDNQPTNLWDKSGKLETSRFLKTVIGTAIAGTSTAQ